MLWPLNNFGGAFRLSTPIYEEEAVPSSGMYVGCYLLFYILKIVMLVKRVWHSSIMIIIYMSIRIPAYENSSQTKLQLTETIAISYKRHLNTLWLVSIFATSYWYNSNSSRKALAEVLFKEITIICLFLRPLMFNTTSKLMIYDNNEIRL